MSRSPQESQNKEPIADSLALIKPLTDSLLVVFIHGFKGTDSTFGGFPARMEHVLKQTLAVSQVECVVFPAYETKGDLKEAVVRFADWLTEVTVKAEVKSGGGAGSAKIVLCGHSMGGLLAADVFLEFFNSRPDDKAPLWPRIVACIAFDTPYLGLHPAVFKNTATKISEYATAAQTVASGVLGSFAAFRATKPTSAPPSNKQRIQAPPANKATTSTWSNWGTTAFAAGGALLAGAAAGTAYYKREDLGLGYSWATDHMKYVGNLWDEAALKQRVAVLVEADEKHGILFRTFYTLLPPTPPQHASARTFIVLPPPSAPSAAHFLPARNGLAPDELQAHTGMFGANSNDGYYALGLEFAALVREAIDRTRGIAGSQADNQTAAAAMNDHSAKTNPLEEVVDTSMQL